MLPGAGNVSIGLLPWSAVMVKGHPGSAVLVLPDPPVSRFQRRGRAGHIALVAEFVVKFYEGDGERSAVLKVCNLTWRHVPKRYFIGCFSDFAQFPAAENITNLAHAMVSRLAASQVIQQGWAEGAPL